MITVETAGENGRNGGFGGACEALPGVIGVNFFLAEPSAELKGPAGRDRDKTLARSLTRPEGAKKRSQTHCPAPFCLGGMVTNPCGGLGNIRIQLHVLLFCLTTRGILW